MHCARNALSRLFKLYLFLSILFIWCHLGYSQDQPKADSLEAIYLAGSYERYQELSLLRQICEHTTDPDKKISFSAVLIEKSRLQDSIYYEMVGYLETGNALRLKSDLRTALENYFESARVASEAKYSKQLGTINIAIGDVYSIMEDHDNAVKYYGDAIKILRQENDSVNLASALLNVGDEYFNVNRMDSALRYFQESGDIFDELDYAIGVAYNLGNVGLVYAQMGLNISAEDNINKAIDLLTATGDYYPISVYLTYMSDIYIEKKDIPKALAYAEKSLELAELHGLKEQIRDANLKLSEIHGLKGDLNTEFKYYQIYVAYKDSINNVETVQQLANLRTDYEVSKKQIEVDLLNQKQKNQRVVIIATVSTTVLILVLATGLAHRYRYIRKTNNIIEEEKNRSEKLLLNILPEHTADELKAHGKVQAKKFNLVTVLFTDFKEFTKTAEHADPEKLVQSIDFYFKAFDEITTKYDLEKIKTIGDSYMCAGGLPNECIEHPIKIVSAAEEMLKFTNKFNESNENGLLKFELRIGVHTGPVIAGIVGNKKWQYDIWGDTVNIASRMESSSQPGRINLSETTYNLIKNAYDCEFRGEIKVKNHGSINMYFLGDSKS